MILLAQQQVSKACEVPGQSLRKADIPTGKERGPAAQPQENGTMKGKHVRKGQGRSLDQQLETAFRTLPTTQDFKALR